MSNNHLNFAKNAKDDEYYTRRFLVDLIFSKTVEVFGTDKVLYVLGADTDQSFFTKYAKAHHLHYVNNIDFYDVPYFIFKNGWKTVVITNPPFSLLTDWLKKMQPVVENDKLQLCLIIPLLLPTYSSLVWYLKNCYFYPFNARMKFFFHQAELKGVNTMLMTTFPLSNWPVYPKEPVPPQTSPFITPVTRIIYKNFYEACGYHLVGVDPNSKRPLFLRYLWEKNKNNPE